MLRRTTTFAVLLLTCLGAGSAGAAPRLAARADCTSAQWRARQVALQAFSDRMPAARRAYFQAHKAAALRKHFVVTQNATLAHLQQQAECTVPIPPDQGVVPAPTPTAGEHFVFTSEITPDDQDVVRGDVAFAAQDEQTLLGVPFGSVTVYASGDPNWLATQECAAQGQGQDCVTQTAARYAGNTSAGEAVPGALFLYWIHAQWSHPDETQKVIAHELFHVFQFQMDQITRDAQTPPDAVRLAGPVWLFEGAPEMVGYRVAADRHLWDYRSKLQSGEPQARLLGASLSRLQTLNSESLAGYSYMPFLIAVDHLISLAPGGIRSLAGYYQALAAGSSWPDAFQAAFGRSAQQYSDEFDAYRAKLQP